MFICNYVVSVRMGFFFLLVLGVGWFCFIVTLPGPSDLETWYILQSVQRKTNALILLSGYGAILRICFFLSIYFVALLFVDLVFDVYGQQRRLLTTS